MSNLRAVFIGHVCIDRNVTEHAEYTSWGSPVLYMARYFHDHFGVNPDVITTYGKDMLPYASQFRFHPSEPQVDVTQLNENIRSNNRRIDYAHHVSESVPPKLTPKLIKLIEQADILIFGVLLPNYTVDYIKSALKHAKPECVKTLVLQGYLRDIDEEGLVHPRTFAEAGGILPLFDLAIFSDEDHPDALEAAQQWKQLAKDTHIIVTEGPHGASIVKDSGSHNIPTRPVPPEDIVDSVGCGDIFAAVVTYYYYRTHELYSAVQAGHRAARVKLVSSNGQQ